MIIFSQPLLILKKGKVCEIAWPWLGHQVKVTLELTCHLNEFALKSLHFKQQHLQIIVCPFQSPTMLCTLAMCNIFLYHHVAKQHKRDVKTR